MSLEPPRPGFMFAPEANDEFFLPEPVGLRIGILAFSGVLVIAGLWLLVTALLLPQAIALPLDRTSAAAAAAYRDNALWAARLGVVRGDLFAQAAYTDADLIWLYRTHGPDAANAARLQRAKANAEAAVALAPVNGAAWLLLAELPPGSGKAAEAKGMIALQMSYFTAPNNASLAAARIEQALASPEPLDRDLQEFMKGDLRQILTLQPEQKPAILAAYKAATPQNQASFEALSAQADPDFGQSLRGDAPK
ncbi:conserved hypothetical protein [Methylocella tundrae]|uniref:Uncharacterized protein n=1 Tax=Methylocella tundrae TaxID=227605 RepID=A0A8B6M179_METTU|nr:hypothetical protein [Methylocella tundrae]VTZ27732.1 conserved hypothetical protein [Methylocella tundrae]VTZ48578.1 conserved hypothetical protein [Methylocella tundrae]